MPSPSIFQDAAAGYERHFGLREAPFALTANPRYLFESRAHAGAFDEIVQALQRHEPLIVITGAAGTGKTLVCRIVGELRDARTFVAVISAPPATGDDLLRSLLDQFGVLARESRGVAEAGRFELVRTLQQFLASLAPLQARAVIVVDEAHRLSAEILEQLRWLSNFETDARKLLQIVLLGEPRLDDMLDTPELHQLGQRATRRYSLGPLAPDEVGPYIARRLSVALGRELASPELFSGGAIDAIASLSGGVPRRVNVLCDRSLELARDRSLASADRRTVIAAAEKLKFPVPLALRVRQHGRAAAAAAALLVLASGVAWWAISGRAARGATESRSSTPPAPPATATQTKPPAPSAPAGRQVLSPSPPTTSPPPPSSASSASEPGTSRLPTQQPAPAAPAPSSRSATGTGAYQIIASSFRTPARAEALAEQVAKLGLPVRVRASSGWHQVVVGPYATRAEASAAVERLEDVYITDPVIASIEPRAEPEASAPAARVPAAPAPAARVPAGRAPEVRAPARGPAPALPPAAPQSLDTLLQRATALSRAPDVRGLLQLRQQVEARSQSMSPGEREAVLKEVDVLLDEARRRQLEIDARAFQKPAR